MRFYILVVLIVTTTAGLAGATRDGKRFDTGATMTTPAPGAPEATARLTFMIGQWDVEYEVFEGDSLIIDADGTASITFMNRGHGYMERFFCSGAANGMDLATIGFLMFNPTAQTWVMGVANSYTENISVFNGNFDGEYLILRNVLRRRGGATLTFYRMTFSRSGDDAFTVETAASPDMGDTWTQRIVKSYTRRPKDSDFMVASSVYGSPAPDRPQEAAQFDFLIGEWSLVHDMTFPNGQQVKFGATGTAVHVLDGHAIMEFSWYDVDPNLPDAATSIVRIYNRNMRRWECMYTTNRANSILYFGGVKEGDRIVLHQFNAHAGDAPMNQWTFHSWSRNAYGWYGNTSNDRGKTWKKTWLIEAERK